MKISQRGSTRQTQVAGGTWVRGTVGSYDRVLGEPSPEVIDVQSFLILDENACSHVWKNFADSLHTILNAGRALPRVIGLGRIGTMAFSLFANCPPPYRQTWVEDLDEDAEAGILPLLRGYLSQTADHPHLHPDCRFKEEGPTLDGRSVGGSIALHQLRRIVRGFEGERLNPENLKQAEADLHGTAGEEDAPEITRIASQRDLMSDTDNSKSGRQGTDMFRRSESELEEPFEEDGLTALTSSAGDMIDKSYNQQMNEQGAKGIIEGEIGQRHTGVTNTKGTPKAKRDAAEKTLKEEKRHKKRKPEEDPAEEHKTMRKDKKARLRKPDEDVVIVNSQEAAPQMAVNGGVKNFQESASEKKSRKRRENSNEVLQQDIPTSQGHTASAKQEGKAKEKKKKKHKDRVLT